MTRILIIEDEESVLEPLELLLSNEGFKVDTAKDGRAGIDKFNDVGADLILLDLMLPEVSGTEVCKRIRQTSNVPIIMLDRKSTRLNSSH